MFDELSGEGWVRVDPPLDRDDTSTIARYDGEPLNAGFLIERVEDSDDVMHRKYRSGRYDVELKIDFTNGDSKIRVDRASGYES